MAVMLNNHKTCMFLYPSVSFLCEIVCMPSRLDKQRTHTVFIVLRIQNTIVVLFQTKEMCVYGQESTQNIDDYLKQSKHQN